MRARVPAGIVAAAAVVVLAAGCGSAGGVRVGSPDLGSAPPECGDVVVTPSAGGGRDVCLSLGSTLQLRLARPGQDADEKGDALTEVSPGVYRGARTGSAELSGFLRACPEAAPGGVSCHAVGEWKVTVDVR